MAHGLLTYTSDIAKNLPDMFSDGSSITQVCARKLKICRDTYYEWKDTYPEFKKAAKMGEQISEAFHEDKLNATADGDLEGSSASARIFIMKSRFRETYGEKQHENPVIPLIASALGLTNDKSKS